MTNNLSSNAAQGRVVRSFKVNNIYIVEILEYPNQNHNSTQPDSRLLSPGRGIIDVFWRDSKGVKAREKALEILENGPPRPCTKTILLKGNYSVVAEWYESTDGLRQRIGTITTWLIRPDSTKTLITYEELSQDEANHEIDKAVQHDWESTQLIKGPTPRL